MIVPFAPGGQNDAIGRLIAQRLSEHLGKQYIIENVGGGGGSIGSGRAAQAAHDGYTILVMDTGLVINPLIYAKVPYDPFKTSIRSRSPSPPRKCSRHAVAAGQQCSRACRPRESEPGQIQLCLRRHRNARTYDSRAVRVSLGLDIVHVPFNGAGPAITSTIAGHTPIAFSFTRLLDRAGEGRQAAGACSGDRKAALGAARCAQMAQAGFPEIEGNFWVGLFVRPHAG